MEIRKVPISLLNAAPYNPRKDLQPGDPEYQKIARSIEKYGCVEPIIWNEKTGNVIGGHQRLKVLAATGAVEVDVSVVQLSLEDLVILITLFAISIVIANVTGARTITTGLNIGPIELALSGGAITYAVTFLCTDIIGEIWGKATAQRVVKYGFIGQIFATACIMLTGVFPATDVVMDNAYQTLLGQNWIFVIGSLSAYLVSQSWDVAVFHAIRDRYIAKHGSTKGGRWLWNNGSTITSQIWDTVIYAVISFGFGLGWVHTHEGRMQLIGIIIGQYLLKACLALLDTPFFYFFTRNADRR